MRKIFLDDLPKHKEGTHKGEINWKKCIGMLVRFIYDDTEGWVEIVDCGKNYLTIRYLDKEPFRIQTDNFKRCSIGRLLGVIGRFKIQIGTILKDDKRHLIITDKKYELNSYNKNIKWYKYTCNKCGWTDGWARETTLLNGQGCSCCSGKTVVEGINDIPTTDPWMVKFFQGGIEEAKKYTRACDKKILPICPDCGRMKPKKMKISTIYRDNSIGCSCGDGKHYPNKFIFNVLEQLKINFINEYSPEWISPKRYDFYFQLDEDKYIIEAHGIQHYEESSRGRGLKKEQENDEIKKNMALTNDIKEENYIIINCRESDGNFIKNNISNSKLNNLFNLNNINWNKCEEFALKNLCKVVCELKHSHPDLTTKDIGKIMNTNWQTIRNYLIKGTELGWCNYDPKEELSKAGVRGGKLMGKKIEIFKNGISLGMFESCSELARQSEELFGVRLDQPTISATCLGKYKTYKGYTFSYV